MIARPAVVDLKKKLFRVQQSTDAMEHLVNTLAVLHKLGWQSSWLETD